jgi:hypothetical protein
LLPDGARSNIGAHVEQNVEMTSAGGLAAGQVEGDKTAFLRLRV